MSGHREGSKADISLVLVLPAAHPPALPGGWGWGWGEALRPPSCPEEHLWFPALTQASSPQNQAEKAILTTYPTPQSDSREACLLVGASATQTP